MIYKCHTCNKAWSRTKIRTVEEKGLIDSTFYHCCPTCDKALDPTPEYAECEFVGRAGGYYGAEDGETTVTVHRVEIGGKGESTKPLPMTYRAEKKSPSGFAWGYGGSGPHALAHSILAYVFDDNVADQYMDRFVWTVIAGLDQNAGFVLTADQVISWFDQWVAEVIWKQGGDQ